MKVEVWYAVDEDGGNFNYTRISEEDRIQLNIQAMVINQ